MLRRRRSLTAPTCEAGSGRARALVYRDRDPESRLCAEAIAEALRRSPWAFDVAFVGPAGSQPLTTRALATAQLFVQPGGGTLDRAYRRVRSARSDVRAHVAAGGRYLGICLGGYLAGATPGYDLLPGDTDRFIDLPDADVSHDGETVIPVVWRGDQRPVYFQDGPHFVVHEGADVEIVARYRNGAIAAMVAPFGSGRVAVCGPHPEATPDWFEDLPVGLPRPRGVDLLEDLVASLLRPGAAELPSAPSRALSTLAGPRHGTQDR